MKTNEAKIKEYSTSQKLYKPQRVLIRNATQV